jgi:nucleotidyltransferase substrate binding protein (TIGR01987 family)
MNNDWRLIFDDYKNLVARLEEVLKQPKSDLLRDSAIKRFELTYELSWKLLKTFLRDQGYLCNSPKSCLMKAFEFGLIEDDSLWLMMMDDRNSSVHTYSEDFANALYGRLNGYLKLFSQLENEVKKYL